LSPGGSIEFPENPVDFRFLEPKEKKQGGAFNAAFNLRPRRFAVWRSLAGADDRLFRRVTHGFYC
jgi:hypothetical protein